MRAARTPLERPLEAVPYLLWQHSGREEPKIEIAGAGYAVETVVPKDEINILIPQLRDKGATDIVELPISKIIP